MEEIEFLEDEVVTIGVGMPLMDTRRFQRIGTESFITLSHSGIAITKAKEESDAEEDERGARFMLSYLSRLVRLVDEAYAGMLGDVEVAMPLRESAPHNFQPWRGADVNHVY